MRSSIYSPALVVDSSQTLFSDAEQPVCAVEWDPTVVNDPPG